MRALRPARESQRRGERLRPLEDRRLARELGCAAVAAPVIGDAESGRLPLYTVQLATRRVRGVLASARPLLPSRRPPLAAPAPRGRAALCRQRSGRGRRDRRRARRGGVLI